MTVIVCKTSAAAIIIPRPHALKWLQLTAYSRDAYWASCIILLFTVDADKADIYMHLYSPKTIYTYIGLHSTK